MPGPGSEVFVAGPYTGSYNAVALGEFDPQDGREVRVEIQKLGRTITGHSYALSEIDGIYQGGNRFISFIGNEQNAAVIQAMWPETSGMLGYTWATMGRMEQVGTLWSAKDAALVFTAVTGTEAATQGPATLTCQAIPTEETREIAFGSDLRQFPCRLRLLPQTATPNTTWWTVT